MQWMYRNQPVEVIDIVEVPITKPFDTALVETIYTMARIRTADGDELLVHEFMLYTEEAP